MDERGYDDNRQKRRDEWRPTPPPVANPFSFERGVRPVDHCGCATPEKT